MKKENKNVLISIAIIVILIIIVFLNLDNIKNIFKVGQNSEVIVNENDIREFVFTVENGEEGRIIYKNLDNATLFLGEKSYDLMIAISGSGARYTNEDDTVSYWEHQGEATIQINDQTYLAKNIKPVEKTDEVKIVENNLSLLTKNEWVWKSALYSNDDIINPNNSEDFIANFSTDGKFSSTTDCNNLLGDYIADKGDLSFGVLASTRKACQGDTKEADYSRMLSQVTSYVILENGDLVLMMKYDYKINDIRQEVK